MPRKKQQVEQQQAEPEEVKAAENEVEAFPIGYQDPRFGVYLGNGMWVKRN